jgi:NADH:flavin oxidoreductase / NADH oxidase family
MTLAEVQATIIEYGKGAANAIKAGCDGVEIHAANGYLPHQFLSPTTNLREDQYGGSVAGRLRFLREVIEAVLVHVPAKRIGVRISPFAAYNNTRDPRPEETYAAVAAMLEGFGVGYIHLADTNAWAGAPDMTRILAVVKPRYSGRREACGRGRCGHSCFRASLSCQPRPAGAHPARWSLQRTAIRGLVWRQRRGLHRLPRAAGGLIPWMASPLSCWHCNSSPVWR